MAKAGSQSPVNGPGVGRPGAEELGYEKGMSPSGLGLRSKS